MTLFIKRNASANFAVQISSSISGFSSVFEQLFLWNTYSVIDYLIQSNYSNNKQKTRTVSIRKIVRIKNIGPLLYRIKRVGKLTLIRSPFVNKASKEQFENVKFVFGYKFTFFDLFIFIFIINTDSISNYQVSYKILYYENGFIYF